jgi:RimJ/RimL family protein N-acetyltransferase
LGWRFAVFSLEDGQLLGEVDLFPRNAGGRAAFADADRVELGYWLRSDVTGRGIITEAALAVLGVAAAMSRFAHVEVRCNSHNAPSIGVAQRLGFTLAEATAPPNPDDGAQQVWTSMLPVQPVAGAPS